MNNLRITTTNAQIGIQTTNGRYEMHQPKGEQSIVQTGAKMSIDKKAPTVIIDTYEQRAELGFKNNMDLLTEAKHLAKQATLNAISRIVSDGNRMANITKRMPAAIPELAEKNSRPPMHEFNFGLTPTSRPKIDVDGYLRINWELGGTDINYQPQKPQIEYTKGNIETYMKQYHEVNIEYIETRG